MLSHSSPLSKAGVRTSLAAARKFFRSREAVSPLALAGVLYWVGPPLKPAERINDFLTSAALWPALAVAAMVLLVLVSLDDRRLRPRLRQAREERLQVVR